MPENKKLFSYSLVQKYAAGHVYTSFLKPTVTIHIYFSQFNLLMQVFYPLFSGFV